MERIGAEVFDGERLRRPGTWALGFLADWCPFCRSFAPELDRLQAAGPFQVAMVDLTDEESPLWERFSIEVVPTMVVFRDGAATFRRDGRLGRGLGDADVTAVREALERA